MTARPRHVSDLRRTARHRRRPAFTLVELLVVMGIILLLAAMAAIFMPGFEQQQRSSSAASQLQEWLLIAKNRALLERAPRGIRLFRSQDPNFANFFTSAQLIEQPEPFSGGSVSSPPDPANPGQYLLNQLVLQGVDVTGGQTDPELYPVQVGNVQQGIGDYIQVQGAGLMHQFVIAQVGPNTATLQLFSPLSEAISTPTPYYRIVRQPRPIGEDPFEMPNNVGIDLKTNVDYNQPLPFNPDGTLDVLFSPSGTLIGNFGSDRMIFWVRDMADQNNPDSAFIGSPALIVVFTRSGLVASYDVDMRARTNASISPYSKIR